MCIQLPAKKPTMNNNVPRFGSAVMADKCHIASEDTVIGEPAMYGLTREISTRFSCGINDGCWTKESAIDARMVVYVDIAEPLSISGSASKESVTFWYNAIVTVKRCLEPNRTRA